MAPCALRALAMAKCLRKSRLSSDHLPPTSLAHGRDLSPVQGSRVPCGVSQRPTLLRLRSHIWHAPHHPCSVLTREWCRSPIVHHGTMGGHDFDATLVNVVGECEPGPPQVSRPLPTMPKSEGGNQHPQVCREPAPKQTSDVTGVKSFKMRSTTDGCLLLIISNPSAQLGKNAAGLPLIGLLRPKPPRLRGMVSRFHAASGRTTPNNLFKKRRTPSSCWTSNSRVASGSTLKT